VENGNAAKTTRMTARHAVPVHEEYEEMSMDEIMNGKGEAFPGLLNLVYMYLDTLDVSVEERARIDQYLDLVKARSNGEGEPWLIWSDSDYCFRHSPDSCDMDPQLCAVTPGV
jgi:hypothetical protein